MVCKYCGAATTKYSVCKKCRELIRYYKSIAGYTKGKYTTYSQVRVARVEYELLMLPNPPVDLIRLYNNDMWPKSLHYVRCDGCGKKDLVGRGSSHKHKIYCAECEKTSLLG